MPDGISLAVMANWFSKFFQQRVSNIQVLAAGEKKKSQPPISGSVDGEHGVTGTDIFGGTIQREEYNNDLRGRLGIEAYEKMRRSDGQIRAMLQVMKLPLRAAKWSAEPPEHGDTQDQEIADFINQALFDDDAMDSPWDDALQHILLQLDYGHSILEHVFRVDDQGYYRLKRLAPRLPRTIYYWDVLPNGDLRGVWQYAPVISDMGPDFRNSLLPGSMPSFTGISNYQYLYIPSEVMTCFTFQREGSNYEGISLLRTAYKHWWYKDLLYHLDAVRNDRFGVGIPTADLEEGHDLTVDDLNTLEDVLKDLRANERVFLIAPPRVTFSILTPDSQGSGNDILKMVDHQDAMIARNVLAGFLTLGRDTRGTQAYGTRLTDFFVSSLYGIANGIAADLKKGIVKQLCDLNFTMEGREYPSIVVRDLEAQNVEQTVELTLKALGSVLTPDDSLEDFLRTSLKLPPRPEDMERTPESRLASGKPDAPEPQNPEKKKPQEKAPDLENEGDE